MHSNVPLRLIAISLTPCFASVAHVTSFYIDKIMSCNQLLVMLQALFASVIELGLILCLFDGLPTFSHRYRTYNFLNVMSTILSSLGFVMVPTVTLSSSAIIIATVMSLSDLSGRYV